MDSDEAYRQVIRPKLDILHVLCSNYMEMGYYVDWNKLNGISTEGSIGFYERRMEKVEEYLKIAFYLMFVLAVCILPVFASEYESGAAALLLTTKYGKTKLIWAKISAAVLLF